MQELDAARLQRRDTVSTMSFGGDRDVLHAGAAVEIEVLVDLRLLLARGRLVDRELDPAVAVRHHLGHERGILGRDVLVVEA